MDLRKHELEIGRPFTSETMACHRNKKADPVCLAVWIGILLLVVGCIVAICCGHLMKVLGAWVFLGALYAVYDSFDRSCWWGIAQLTAGGAGILIGAVMMGAGA